MYLLNLDKNLIIKINFLIKYTLTFDKLHFFPLKYIYFILILIILLTL